MQKVVSHSAISVHYGTKSYQILNTAVLTGFTHALVSDSSLRKTLKVMLKVMKPVGPAVIFQK